MAAPNTQMAAAFKPEGTGGVHWAPLGTALPTDATTALPAGYEALGYIGEGGIQPSRETNVEKPKAWGGDVIASLLVDESRGFEFTLLEVFSKEVQDFVHGSANVTLTAATASDGEKLAVLDKGGKPDRGVLVFSMRFGDKKRRVIIPVADSVITGEEPWTDGGLSAYTVQVEAIKNAAGVRAYDYLENDNKAA